MRGGRGGGGGWRGLRSVPPLSCQAAFVSAHTVAYCQRQKMGLQSGLKQLAVVPCFIEAAADCQTIFFTTVAPEEGGVGGGGGADLGRGGGMIITRQIYGQKEIPTKQTETRVREAARRESVGGGGGGGIFN